ncbi:MAG: SMC-Scp complex subunit ScpB [Candidatus Thermoplasmatota archaeon]
MGVKEDRLVESVLFSSAKPLSIDEIKEATGLSEKKVRDALQSIIDTYNIKRKDETSIEIVKAGNKYAMQVKRRFLEHSKMVAKPEIHPPLLKTLALIAFHQPIKQSNLRRMIGEKVYGHVDQLSAMHLISTKKHGSTEILTTTRLFPEYFGIDSTKPEEIREFLAKKVIGGLDSTVTTMKSETAEMKETKCESDENDAKSTMVQEEDK